MQTQIIPALKFLHDQKICHNDIKSNNILGKLDGFYVWWKITDFDHSAKFSKEFEEPGYYKAPEIARGLQLKQALVARYTIDMWALGCMIGDLLLHDDFYNNLETDPTYT